MLRLFKGKAVWQSFDRKSDADHPARRAYETDMAIRMHRKEYDTDLFREGLAVRRKALGYEFVNKSLMNASEFDAAFQKLSTEVAYGLIWKRQGLDFKTRSIINIALLATLNRPDELKLHTRAAIQNNNVTIDEVKEILLHVAIYSGFPAARSSFTVVSQLLQEMQLATTTTATTGTTTTTTTNKSKL